MNTLFSVVEILNISRYPKLFVWKTEQFAVSILQAYAQAKMQPGLVLLSDS